MLVRFRLRAQGEKVLPFSTHVSATPQLFIQHPPRHRPHTPHLRKVLLELVFLDCGLSQQTEVSSEGTGIEMEGGEAGLQLEDGRALGSQSEKGGEAIGGRGGGLGG